jgi:hypothetical protein
VLTGWLQLSTMYSGKAVPRTACVCRPPPAAELGCGSIAQHTPAKQSGNTLPAGPHLNTPQKVQLFLVPIWLTIWSMLQPYRSLYDSTCSQTPTGTHTPGSECLMPPCTAAAGVGLTSSRARLDQATAGRGEAPLACMCVQPGTRPTVNTLPWTLYCCCSCGGSGGWGCGCGGSDVCDCYRC